MRTESIEILAGGSFPTGNELHKKIVALETSLGLPVGDRIFNVRKSKNRIKELERMVQLGGMVTKGPDTTLPQAPVVSPAVAPVAEAKRPTEPGLREGWQVSSYAVPGRVPAVPHAGREGVFGISFLKMDAEARDTFSRDGNAINLSTFDEMTPAAKIRHLELGGKLSDSDSADTRDFAPDRAGGTRGVNYSNIMTRSVFESLGLASQKTFLKFGGRVGRG
jgi:hypothetical protein